MAEKIALRTSVELGVVPTHIRFVGGLVPDEQGRLPRGDDGKLLVLTEMAHLVDQSPVKISSAQISVFPGVEPRDNDEMINGLKDLDLAVHLILMVGGADPMNPEDEDAVVGMLVEGLNLAKQHGITLQTQVNSFLRQWGSVLVNRLTSNTSTFVFELVTKLLPYSLQRLYRLMDHLRSDTITWKNSYFL